MVLFTFFTGPFISFLSGRNLFLHHENNVFDPRRLAYFTENFAIVDEYSRNNNCSQ